MKNLDLQNENMIKIQSDMAAALEKGDNEAFAKQMVEMAKGIETSILQEAKSAINENFQDREVMIKRGLNPLTTEEKEYYNEVITAGGFDGVQKLVPVTVFDRIFEDLVRERPLLGAINFVNVGGVTEWITRNEDVQGAWWGPLTEEIKKELTATFSKVQTNLYKLSAFMLVSKPMLDLGPEWLDRFVRTVLGESVAIALELAIIQGTGKNQPIGMIKNLAGAVVDGVYPDKTPVSLNDLSPATLGTKVMAPLTKEGKKTVNNVLMVVNPLDYWNKIFAKTTILTQNGTYVYGVMPIPGNIVQSVAVPQNRMVVGRAKDYFMGVGSERKVDYSDHYKFLEDERVYIVKQYANGKPMDNDSFIVFDISGMATPEVPEA